MLHLLPGVARIVTDGLLGLRRLFDGVADGSDGPGRDGHLHYMEVSNPWYPQSMAKIMDFPDTNHLMFKGGVAWGRIKG